MPGDTLEKAEGEGQPTGTGSEAGQGQRYVGRTAKGNQSQQHARPRDELPSKLAGRGFRTHEETRGLGLETPPRMLADRECLLDAFLGR